MPYQMTMAELLIEAARAMKSQPGKLIIAGDCLSEPIRQARMALAMKLMKAPPVIRFRAIMENWSLSQIIRELNV